MKKFIVFLALVALWAIPVQAAIVGDILLSEDFTGDDVDESIEDMSTSAWVPNAGFEDRTATWTSYWDIGTGRMAVHDSSFGTSRYYHDLAGDPLDLSTVPAVEVTWIQTFGMSYFPDNDGTIAVGSDNDFIAADPGDHAGIYVWFGETADDIDNVVIHGLDESGETADTILSIPVNDTAFNDEVFLTLELKTVVSSTSSEFFYRMYGDVPYISIGTLSGISADLAKLGLTAYGPAWRQAFDEINVEVIPEPMTLAVLGLGALAALLRRRR